jgi:ectoine hydroxylase-related dioxygenase (phytanoyl-CoA dioxygenase family)
MQSVWLRNRGQRMQAVREMQAAIRELGLEPYVLELELNGLTVVPPEVHGVGLDRVDQMVDLILAWAEERTGSSFSLDRGPAKKLVFPPGANSLAGRHACEGETTQFLLQKLTSHHRAFRDLAVNPVSVTLMRHLIGPRATRFSSHSCFVKWRGEFGYGPNLGLHADQTAVPLPWGRMAYTANTNWCLTEYTKDAGAFAYVPGSHRAGTRPTADAPRRAVALEAPMGSLIVFHGATWHGAFPRVIPGMRISVANYHRHVMVTSQEDIQGSFPRELASDCDNPQVFRELAGFDDVFPYKEQPECIPRAVD